MAVSPPPVSTSLDPQQSKAVGVVAVATTWGVGGAALGTLAGGLALASGANKRWLPRGAAIGAGAGAAVGVTFALAIMGAFQSLGCVEACDCPGGGQLGALLPFGAGGAGGSYARRAAGGRYIPPGIHPQRGYR